MNEKTPAPNYRLVSNTDGILGSAFCYEYDKEDAKRYLVTRHRLMPNGSLFGSKRSFDDRSAAMEYLNSFARSIGASPIV